MANKIITDVDENRQYFLHYYVFKDSENYKVQASLFDDRGILVSRKSITLERINELNITNIIRNLMQKIILPPDLSEENILN